MIEGRSPRTAYSELNAKLRSWGFVALPGKPRKFWHEETHFALGYGITKPLRNIAMGGTVEFHSRKEAFFREPWKWVSLVNPHGPSIGGSGSFSIVDDDWLDRVEQCVAASLWFPFGHPRLVPQLKLHLCDTVVSQDIQDWLQRVDASRPNG